MAAFPNYSPDQGATMTRTPRIRSVKFGDGYEQRGLDGINANPQKWTLTWSGKAPSDAATIEAFLVAQGGVTSFTWTPPVSGAVSSNWVCRSWTRTRTGFTTETITATFEEVF